MRRIRRFKAGEEVEPGNSVSWPLFPVNYAWRRQGSTKSGVRPPHVFGQLFHESRTKRPPSDPFCQSYADPEVRSTVFGHMGWDGKTCVPKNVKNVPSEKGLTVWRG